jgi:hypothetical protein
MRSDKHDRFPMHAGPARSLITAAALTLAGCAGGANAMRDGVAPTTGPGFTQTGGVNVAYAEFQNSAFPYRGAVPDQDRPFLDVNDNGRLGHASPRGGVYWEDQTYSDRHVMIAAAPEFDARRGGDLVLYFHGNQAMLARDVFDRQQAPQQLAQSGLNGVMVAPQMAVDALDSSAGRFWQPGGLAAFLNEADQRLAELYPAEPRASFRRLPVIIVAFSGGYLPAAYSLAVGGAENRVRGVVLLDALYGEEDKFADWIERWRGRAFFVSAYSKSSREENEALRRRLIAAGVPVQDKMPDRLGPGVVAFVDAGDAVHDDFVSAAWTSQPLRDVLARAAQ